MLNRVIDALEMFSKDRRRSVEAWEIITGKRVGAKTAQNYLYGMEHAAKANNWERVCDTGSKIVVGVFGDVHLPFEKKGYIDFVQKTFDRFGVSDVVCTGDLIDNHAISRHISSPDSMGALEEYKQTMKELEKYKEAFPILSFCIGNHDGIPIRQAATLGIPRAFIKNPRELWELPDTWETSESFLINGVLYEHGLGAGGKDGAFNFALARGRSVVVGHTHCYGGVKSRSDGERQIFGLNVGCGIDEKAYAFEYGKFSKYRSTIGCGIVFNEQFAIYVPMIE